MYRFRLAECWVILIVIRKELHMTTSNGKTGTPRRLTPLWVISLLVGLTEATLGVAVTQTTGAVQVALTIFVVVFPVLIAAGFFAVLWYKPYAFYAPSEYGKQVSVEQYVQAIGGATGPIVRDTKDVQDGDVETFGNPDRLTLLFKAKGATWVRSTKAMAVHGGCVVQFSTKFLTPDGSWNIAEAATYVPDVAIHNEPDGEGRFLARRTTDAK